MRNKYERVTFGSLKVGEYFRYNNLNFCKTLVVDMGTFIYNASTDEIGQYPWSYWKITYIPDDKIVRKIIEKG